MHNKNYLGLSGERSLPFGLLVKCSAPNYEFHKCSVIKNRLYNKYNYLLFSQAPKQSRLSQV